MMHSVGTTTYRACIGRDSIAILSVVSSHRLLRHYVIRYRGAFVLGVICSFVATGITLLAPVVLQRAIDDLTGGVTGTKLFLYGCALLAIGLVGGVFRFWTRRILI